MNDIKKVGVLTSGGDAPGMNAAVRSVVRCGLYSGFEMYGVYNGYNGLLNEEIVKLEASDVGNMLQRGGTILNTARSPEFNSEKGVKKAIENAKKYGIDAMVVIGGDGSFRGARDLTNNGLPTIGIPGTIDNDIACSEYTIGFDTALNTAMEAVDKIKDTCTSHQRCSIIEVMGRHAGYIALSVAIATGAENVLIPEFPFDFEKDIIASVKQSRAIGKRNHIIIVAEGVPKDNKLSSTKMAKMIEEETGMSTRAAILGHMQRGGSPTVHDRVMASKLGEKAISLLMEGKSNRVVVVKDGKITDIDINEGLSIKKSVDVEEYKLVSMLSI